MPKFQVVRDNLGGGSSVFMAMRVTSGSGSAATEALRFAFENHYLETLRLAMLLTGTRENAEDLTHDTFVATAEHIIGLSDGEVGAYLRRSMINRWKNNVRRLSIERRLSSRFLLRKDQDAQPAVEDRDLLWRAIRSLPSRQRACVILRYYLDMSERDIAQALDCSIGTVKSHTSRALSRLRWEVQDDN
ncbi:MAG: SigE family RNA polymerase sigma factor [Gemmatimonadota bacterium]|nr:SigE family RNA polymerase sigma factor [Gemmatimonadota bacterium]